MRITQFLEYHGIQRNPFAEEDAQTDPVFKDHCIASTFHPTWDKVYGDPRDPSTAVVFGEKGSGKTAMRLQIARHIERFNREHVNERVFVIHYEDFNPFLDRFVDRFSGRKRRVDRALAHWKLWDHMDAILSLGVTDLVDRMLSTGGAQNADPATEIPADRLAAMTRHQARDFLLLAACYDQSLAETFSSRMGKLRSRLRFGTWKARGRFWLGCTWILAAVVAVVTLLWTGHGDWVRPPWLVSIIAGLGFAPWLWWEWRAFWLAYRVLKHVRIGTREMSQLRSALRSFTSAEIAGQPLPSQDRSDDRFELLIKFQSVLKTLGYSGIVVLVDRIDEPHRITGSAELMKALLWPMLDNKFLKHPGVGLKLMVPLELARFLDREDKAFYERARLDKQNLIRNFEWTGEALFDVANARIQACSGGPSKNRASVCDLFAAGVTERRLLDAFRQLRVPRRLFKFLYGLLVNHCSAHTDHQPVWQISSEQFESTLAVTLRDQDAFDRGQSAG